MAILTEGVLVRIGGDATGLNQELRKAGGMSVWYGRVVATALVGAAVQFTKLAIEADRSFRVLAASTGKHSKDLDGMRRQYTRLALESKRSVDEIVKAQQKLAFTPVARMAQQPAVTRAAAQFSAATGTDLAQSLELVATRMVAFNRPASEAERTAAELFALFREGKTDTEKLGQGLGDFGSRLAESAKDLEDLRNANNLTTTGMAADWKAFFAWWGRRGHDVGDILGQLFNPMTIPRVLGEIGQGTRPAAANLQPSRLQAMGLDFLAGTYLPHYGPSLPPPEELSVYAGGAGRIPRLGAPGFAAGFPRMTQGDLAGRAAEMAGAQASTAADQLMEFYDALDYWNAEADAGTERMHDLTRAQIDKNAADEQASFGMQAATIAAGGFANFVGTQVSAAFGTAQSAATQFIASLLADLAKLAAFEFIKSVIPLPGFPTGGYAGMGGVAALHKGEYVLSAATVRNMGLPALERANAIGGNISNSFAPVVNVNVPAGSNAPQIARHTSRAVLAALRQGQIQGTDRLYRRSGRR